MTICYKSISISQMCHNASECGWILWENTLIKWREKWYCYTTKDIVTPIADSRQFGWSGRVDGRDDHICKIIADYAGQTGLCLTRGTFQLPMPSKFCEITGMKHNCYVSTLKLGTTSGQMRYGLLDCGFLFYLVYVTWINKSITIF